MIDIHNHILIDVDDGPKNRACLLYTSDAADE